MFARSFLPLLCAALAPLARAEPALTQVSGVSALTLTEAGRHLPVRLRGVITYREQSEARAFVQDETGGVFFRPPPVRAGETEIGAGEFVEITGVTWRGRFSPSVAGDPADAGLAPIREGVKPVRLTRLGRRELPAPREARLEQILTGEMHNQLVTLRATMRGAAVQRIKDWSGLRVELTTRAGLFVALVRRAPGEEAVPANWSGVEADFRAVVAGSGDEQGQFRDPWLAVESLREIVPDFTAAENALAQPVRGFRELFRYAPAGPAPGRERVHVAGTVTMVRPREGFYLGGEDGGIWVEAWHSPELREGDVVDVLAFPARREKQSFLQDEISRVRQRGTPLAAQPTTPDEAAGGNWHAALVALDGEVLDQLTKPGLSLLFLAAGGRRFTAQSEGAGANAALPSLIRGSRVRVTGICENPPDSASGGEASGIFSLRLRSAADVAVLRVPRWLTTQRLTWLLAGLGSAILVGVAWVALLHRQVSRQTRTIETQVAQRTVLEERQRIARELHDTLEQQLAGVNLHLDAATARGGDLPPPVAGEIARARAMLQHSRAEARRSIVELRSQALDQLGLVGALRESIAQLGPLEAPAIALEVRGEERRLPRNVGFSLLRIAQEAMTNALKHARASRLEITLAFDETETRFVIADDGAGFDPAAAASANGVHFGLLGMRERAAKIGGTIELASRPEHGTTITVSIPATPATRLPSV